MSSCKQECNNVINWISSVKLAVDSHDWVKQNVYLCHPVSVIISEDTEQKFKFSEISFNAS